MENEEVRKEINKELVIEYANILLPKIQESINNGEFGETISSNELLLAIGAVLPQAIYENVYDAKEDKQEVSLLEINHIINELLFELK